MNRIEELGEFARGLGCGVRFGEPMSRHTTFRIGGPADLFLTVGDRAALRAVRRKAFGLEVPVFPLGNGSNLLVGDAGVRGAVVTLGGTFRKIVARGETELECGAGASLAGLCKFARDRSLTGLEFAYGIPGLVGGAAFMNAGAYGHSVSEAIVSCSHVTAGGEAGVLRGEALGFGYRRSAYTDNGALITAVRVKLERGDPDEISEKMEDLYARRKAKQPLELPSAGSVFKRPPGQYAGTLIEACGLKGQRVGGAVVSEKHAGFIVNAGGATCEDVRRLIGRIRETVFQKTGVRLECEVKMIG